MGAPRPGEQSLTLSSRAELLERPPDFAGELLRSFAYSALQSPVSGVAQLCDRASADAGSLVGVKGTKLLPNVQFMSAPKEAAFGSSTWHAQQLGSAGGLACDLILVSLAARKVMPAGQIGSLTEAQLAEHSRRQIYKTAMTGVVLGGVFTPVKPGDDFWQARGRSAVVQGLTFGILAASSQGLKSAGQMLDKSGRVGGSVLRNEIFCNIAAGVPAGLVHAQSESLLSGKGLAGLNETGKSIYAFSTVGGFLGAAGAMAPGRAGGRASESLPRTENVGAAKQVHEIANVSSRGKNGELRTSSSTTGGELLSLQGRNESVADTVLPTSDRVRSVLADGTAVVEFPGGGSNGTRRILTKTDGTQVFERIDGLIKTRNPDGSKVTEFPPGKGERWRVTEKLDGSRITEYRSGDKVTTKSDGTVITEYPAEGKLVIESSDGTMVTRDPSGTIVDVQKLDPLKGIFHREITTTNSAGQTTVENPTVSRCGEFEIVNGYIGRRKISHDRPDGAAVIEHERVEFASGPTSVIERRSDGTWRQEYRQGSICSEGYDYTNGELVRFLELSEHANPAIIEQVRTQHPQDSVMVFRQNDATHWHQTYRPDGRIETIYQEGAWRHEGRSVSTEVVYPEGSVSRYYQPSRSAVASDLTLSNGVKISELKHDFSSDLEPSFEISGPDGSKIELSGGKIDPLSLESSYSDQPNQRTSLDFDLAGRRVGADGREMLPYDVYDVQKGSAVRQLYRDGSLLTLSRDGRSLEVKYAEGVELRVQSNGRIEVKHIDGSGHLVEFNRLIESYNRSKRVQRYD